MVDKIRTQQTDITTHSNKSLGVVGSLGLWGIAVTVLVGVLYMYLQPTFLVTLATQVWACF